MPLSPDPAMFRCASVDGANCVVPVETLQIRKGSLSLDQTRWPVELNTGTYVVDTTLRSVGSVTVGGVTSLFLTGRSPAIGGEKSRVHNGCQQQRVYQ